MRKNFIKKPLSKKVLTKIMNGKSKTAPPVNVMIDLAEFLCGAPMIAAVAENNDNLVVYSKAIIAPRERNRYYEMPRDVQARIDEYIEELRLSCMTFEYSAFVSIATGNSKKDTKYITYAWKPEAYGNPNKYKLIDNLVLISSGIKLAVPESVNDDTLDSLIASINLTDDRLERGAKMLFMDN